MPTAACPELAEGPCLLELVGAHVDLGVVAVARRVRVEAVAVDDARVAVEVRRDAGRHGRVRARVDAGAAQKIRQAVIDLARSGSAVVVISQDLDEIMEISDRIAVMSDGQLSEPENAEMITREEIGLKMGGLHDG